MAQYDSQSVVGRATDKLFEPIYRLCSLVKDVSDVVESKVPEQEKLWEARRKNEFTMGQITGVRQLENRIHADQIHIQAVILNLDTMEMALGSLEEKAEAANYETVVQGQKIPAIKALLAKYQLVRPISLSASSSASPNCPLLVNPRSKAKPPAPPRAVRAPVVRAVQRPQAGSATHRACLERVIGAPSSSSRKRVVRPSREWRPSSLRKATINAAGPRTSGIPPPGFMQSPVSGGNLNISYRSPYMSQCKSVPQSATNRVVVSTPQTFKPRTYVA